MAETSSIEWTEATWNPWLGCNKVSPGCAHCYMFTEQRRYGNDPQLVRRSKTTFTHPLKWDEPRTIFTCSWSDWFHPDADPWRDEAWEIIRATPHHTYQILTKRPERMEEKLPSDWSSGYPNVWLGVSIEAQRYDFRAALLCRTPAAVRFVSAEPLIGPLDLTRVNPFAEADDRQFAVRDRSFHGLNVLALPSPAPMLSYHNARGSGRIDWVIAGGESGPDARPFDLRWARALRDHCAEAGVAFFLKQLGGFPNKRGGEAALLDGRRHTEMPGAHV